MLRQIALLAFAAVFSLTAQETSVEQQELEIVASETVFEDNDNVTRNDQCRRSEEGCNTRPRCPDKCQTKCQKKDRCSKEKKGAARKVVEGD